MPAGPTLDVSEDYNLFDNQEDVWLVNPDGQKVLTTALREEVDTVPVDVGGGNIAFHTYTTWHVFRNRLNGFTPRANGFIQDPNGVKWFIGAINLQTWGTRWRLTCEAEAGEGTRQIIIPPVVTQVFSEFIWDIPNGDRKARPIEWATIPDVIGAVTNANQ